MFAVPPGSGPPHGPPLRARGSRPAPRLGRRPARSRQARTEGYLTAKARGANRDLNRLLLPSEHARLVEDATRLALSAASVTDCGPGLGEPMDVVAARGLGRRVRGSPPVMRIRKVGLPQLVPDIRSVGRQASFQ
jgi:hypothetical protein